MVRRKISLTFRLTAVKYGAYRAHITQLGRPWVLTRAQCRRLQDLMNGAWGSLPHDFEFMDDPKPHDQPVWRVTPCGVTCTVMLPESSGELDDAVMALRIISFLGGQFSDGWGENGYDLQENVSVTVAPDAASTDRIMYDYRRMLRNHRGDRRALEEELARDRMLDKPDEEGILRVITVPYVEMRVPRNKKSM